MPEYQYYPLADEQIRLLKLFPAQERTAVLEGNLLIRKLHANDRITEVEHPLPVVETDDISILATEFQPSSQNEWDQASRDARTVTTPDHVQGAEQYEALSYTWGGEPGPSHIIKILDGGQAYTIPITANLESALRHLRPCKDVKYLWVDALCINQVNHVEKGSQIPKIADIYNQATTVRVWLGEEKDDSQEALKFIRRVLNLGNLDQLVQDKLTSSGWAAFLHLMKRSWFSRRWIVQEIALAREAYLHCGDESVTWREFAEAVSLFTSKHHDVRKLFQGSELFDNHPDFLGEIEQLGASRLVDTSSNLFRKSDDGTIMEHLLSLEALMSSLSVFEASNPHDIVYAILWLANDAAPSTEEARGSSLNEHGVTHTPQPGSPASDDYSRRASFPFPELRTGRVTNEPAVYNAEGIHASETSLPADMMNEHARLEPAILQDRLAVPNGVQGRKRAASDMSQAPTIRLPGQGAVGGRIVVDYSKTVYEVCKDFLGFVIWQSKSLDIICRPWAPSPDLTKEEELPSWVPKLSGAPFELVDDDYKRVEADPLVGAPGIGRKIYNACGKIRADCHFQDDITRSLFVRGFVLDTVKIKSETAQQGIVPAEWLKVVQWNHGNIPAPDRFWRTLVADRGPDGRRPPPYIYQSACNYAFQRKGLRGDLNIREMIFFGKCPSMAIDFLRRVLSVVWKRSLILTSREEFLGLAPFKAREGDLVCILYGCSVPLVLRKIERHKMNGGAPSPWKRVKPGEALPPRTDSSKSDHYYELIGECYIHGMMDGEAIRHRRLQGLKVEEFELG